MVELKLSYFGHKIRRHELMEKEIMLGIIGGKCRRGRQKKWWIDTNKRRHKPNVRTINPSGTQQKQVEKPSVTTIVR